jgi:hypothetical protein
VKKYLKEKSMRRIFYNNTIKLLEKIYVELKAVNNFLKELVKMNISKEEEEALKKNKKYHNFLEGGIILINLFYHFKFTYDNIVVLEEFKNEGIPSKFNDFSKFNEKVSSFKTNSKRFLFEERLVQLLENTSKVNRSVELSSQHCNLCFSELSASLNTNIFLHDFHIHCINFWINCIDQKSPYQY